ncbi:MULTISPECIES: chaperone modulator CbpM [Yersinia]|uniref:Chaperone modulator CbpM n=2 Tax=Yersinia rochesterensis TaxID=1604335 RepID=A0A386HHJ4_9GAMM|nr:MULTISPECIES: chaperone modulator CbpM [Yersinia]AJI86756.1 chaperone modulatory protein CbpM [Yersinia frederiksenii Y225]CNH80358.1 chaperone-modulator protein CbpM [Yersinia kristensenii]AIN18099.1 chaperone modulatory protein CbpM [Yersinia rochesterensis]AJJ35614.1 merR HTH regulatory family protein [Yersinia rochesterensis]AYD45060.1 chaperone modulator CbpM [Yersinia rochesterensis]
MAEIEITYTLTELCQSTGIMQDELVEVVGLGVIVPLEPTDRVWIFDADALNCLKRARRLQNELDLDWSGVAMTLTLLEKIEQLKKENDQLRRQLDRFVQTS